MLHNNTYVCLPYKDIATVDVTGVDDTAYKTIKSHLYASSLQGVGDSSAVNESDGSCSAAKYIKITCVRIHIGRIGSY